MSEAPFESTKAYIGSFTPAQEAQLRAIVREEFDTVLADVARAAWENQVTAAIAICRQVIEARRIRSSSPSSPPAGG